jgi:alcohol dehydrogenase class IV
MIWRNVGKFIANPTDVEAAGQMLLASCMAGRCFNNVGLGLVHALAHPVGAYFHLPHGLACALYLPAVMKFNASACSEKFASIADAMDQDVRSLGKEAGAEKAIFAVSDLLERMGLPKKLSQLGIQFRLDSKMVDEALASYPGKNNPRRADRSQITEIFESAA